MEDDYNVLYGMKQKHGNNMKGTSNINEYYNNNNNELKHNRNKNTFYDYHLRPVSAKVVRELLSRNDMVPRESKTTIPNSNIKVIVDIKRKLKSASLDVNLDPPARKENVVDSLVTKDLSHAIVGSMFNIDTSDSAVTPPGSNNSTPRRRPSSLSISVSPSKKSTEICTICYELIGYDSSMTFDDCKHSFHSKCLTKWFQQKKQKIKRRKVKKSKGNVNQRRNSRMSTRNKKKNVNKINNNGVNNSVCPSCEISSPDAFLRLTKRKKKEKKKTCMQNSDSDGEPDMERPVNPPPPPPPELYEIESDDSLDEEILL